jgi:hypothetical protein
LENVYWAGFLDGDGSIQISKATTSKTHKAPQYWLYVRLFSSCKEVLMEAQKIFGGTLAVDVRSNSRKKPVWRLELHGDKAYSFLVKVYPHLRVKKDRAEIAIRFWSGRKKYNNQPHFNGETLPEEELKFREECYVRLRELNKKGATV